MGSSCAKCLWCHNEIYEGFPHDPPPEPTNACDKDYLSHTGTPATLGLGCYWTAQAAFDSIPGVLRSRVGTSGGASAKKSALSPDKRLTGPCEVVDLEFDEDQLTFTQIIDVFFRAHDPFKPASQEYQSAIFYHNDKQKEIAEDAICILQTERSQSNLTTGIVHTKVVPAEKVILAERDDQHHNLQVQDPAVLASLGFSTMTIEQIMYSHLISLLNGYLARKDDILQQFEEEKYELKLSEEQEKLIRNMLFYHQRSSVG